jgi:hypothetical protein
MKFVPIPQNRLELCSCVIGYTNRVNVSYIIAARNGRCQCRTRCEGQEGQQAIETDDPLAADVRLSKAEEGDKSAIVELPIVSTGVRTTEP